MGLTNKHWEELGGKCLTHIGEILTGSENQAGRKAETLLLTSSPGSTQLCCVVAVLQLVVLCVDCVYWCFCFLSLLYLYDSLALFCSVISKRFLVVNVCVRSSLVCGLNCSLDVLQEGLAAHLQ